MLMAKTAYAATTNNVVLAMATHKHIFISRDSGITWTDNNFPQLPQYSFFYNISCTGKGDAAICAAIADHSGFGEDVFVTSADGGKTWELNKVSGVFNSIKCTEHAKDNLCVAVGHEERDHSAPLIMVSTDKGHSWTNKTFTHPESSKPNYYHQPLGTLSCSGAGDNSVCIAGDNRGNWMLKDPFPLLVVSSDGGKTWQANPLLSKYESTSVNNVYCSVSGKQNVCLASYVSYHGSTFAVSHDKGKTWSYNDNMPMTPYLLSCMGNSARSDCVTIASDSSKWLSHDNGNTWQQVESPQWNFVPYGFSCAGLGNVSTCVESYGTSANLNVSRNGGMNWKYLQITPVTYYENFYTTSCTGSGASDTVCLAGSSNGRVGVSRDGGKNWEHKQLIDLGIAWYSAVAATGGTEF